MTSQSQPSQGKVSARSVPAFGGATEEVLFQNIARVRVILTYGVETKWFGCCTLACRSEFHLGVSAIREIINKYPDVKLVL